MNQPQVAQASHVAVFCVKTSIDADYVIDYFNRIKEAYQTQVYFVFDWYFY
jgi:hypothetical protein